MIEINVKKSELLQYYKLPNADTKIDSEITITFPVSDIPENTRIADFDVLQSVVEAYSSQASYNDYPWWEDIIYNWTTKIKKETIFAINPEDIVFYLDRGPYCGISYRKLMQSIDMNKLAEVTNISVEEVIEDIDEIETYYPEKRVGVWYEEFPYTGWDKTGLDFFITDFGETGSLVLKKFAEEFIDTIYNFKNLYKTLSEESTRIMSEEYTWEEMTANDIKISLQFTMESGGDLVACFLSDSIAVKINLEY